jgi:hypothetical protein
MFVLFPLQEETDDSLNIKRWIVNLTKDLLQVFALETNLILVSHWRKSNKSRGGERREEMG